MADFIRARSDENKKLRIDEIKHMADLLFKTKTYHDITLSTLANELGWTRSNLYKYVTTKEEIFLDLFIDSQNKYFSNITETFVDIKTLKTDAFAVQWTKILLNNLDFIKYYSILTTIIETNIPLERLITFKKSAFDAIKPILDILSAVYQINSIAANELFSALTFHATGLNNVCYMNPIVTHAMKLAGLEEYKVDFEKDFLNFMLTYTKCFQSN